MAATQFIYAFEDGDPTARKLLGGKGAGLCSMTQIGLPVPPGFVISTEACRRYYADDRTLPSGLQAQLRENMEELEQKTGKGFGDEKSPLLVSVRSGAAISMPGMMDTILNLGLNDHIVERLGELTESPRFAFDAYRRLMQLFGHIALGVPDELFSGILEEAKERRGARFDTELDEDALREICGDYQRLIREKTGRDFPQDPWEQLVLAVEAVFRSWMGKRAVDYRREFKIGPETADGTAVNICTMVFGNMGEGCATGVAFTRDPGTGENVLFGEYLTNAQGEDVVAGIRTPKPVAELEHEMPEQYAELEEVRRTLERHYREVQDFEFTIEKGTLYLLQTRNGKLNATAFVKTSVDMESEELLSRDDALLRITPGHLEQLLHRRIDPDAEAEPIAVGIPASPGAAHGLAVFDADEAERRGRLGEDVILVREETKPEDIHGFFQARAILTSRGGKTSHAAVVARGMGKPCVVGCEAMRVDPAGRKALIADTRISEGDLITVDGATGKLYLGEVPTVEPEFGEDIKTILDWADEVRSLGVRANADTPEDAELAREMGAEGIGLCRTERMFNQADRLPIVREMILADTPEERRAAIDRLEPLQKGDFKEIFRAMEGLPVTIRLLDPPLHEFLPSVESLALELKTLKDISNSVRQIEDLPEGRDGGEGEEGVARLLEELSNVRRSRVLEDLTARKEAVLNKVREITEVNPMLGHRGVRLGIKYPDIYKMQIRAILEAVAELVADGVDVDAEIMVPQVCTSQELKQVHGWLAEVHSQVEGEYEKNVKFNFGTMIEVVRACMRAGPLARVTDFFSFGTNDLTQATFSFSREDAEKKFLPLYNEMQILMDNPFEVLDIKGVGRLMKTAIEWGRKANPELKVGICGEHGGDPRSVEFCHTISLDYVSCSSFRVPIARLTAAQAKLRESRREPDELEHPDYPFNVFFPE